MRLEKYHQKYLVDNKIKQFMSSEIVDTDEQFIKLNKFKKVRKTKKKIKTQIKITQKNK